MVDGPVERNDENVDAEERDNSHSPMSMEDIADRIRRRMQRNRSQQPYTGRRVSRRQFLKMLGLGAGAGIAASAGFEWFARKSAGCPVSPGCRPVQRISK
jgi:ferric-dicitrate binding protein FerR (iron transport regulator)